MTSLDRSTLSSRANDLLKRAQKGLDFKMEAGTGCVEILVMVRLLLLTRNHHYEDYEDDENHEDQSHNISIEYR